MDKYFLWLMGLVGGPDPNYATVLNSAFQTTFLVIIPMDDNRMQDAEYLRKIYYRKTGIKLYTTDITVLEILVSLAKRLDETALVDAIEGLGSEYWFWVLIKNLGLDSYVDSDRMDQAIITEINTIFTRMVARTYDKDGYGGLFPLTNPTRDQIGVDIWFQMMAWLNENTSDGAL